MNVHRASACEAMQICRERLPITTLSICLSARLFVAYMQRQISHSILSIRLSNRFIVNDLGWPSKSFQLPLLRNQVHATEALLLVAYCRKEQDKSMNRDEGAYQLYYIYDNLFAPKLSSERRLDRPFRRSRNVKIINKRLYFNEFEFWVWDVRELLTDNAE